MFNEQASICTAQVLLSALFLPRVKSVNIELNVIIAFFSQNTKNLVRDLQHANVARTHILCLTFASALHGC